MAMVAVELQGTWLGTARGTLGSGVAWLGEMERKGRAGDARSLVVMSGGGASVASDV